MKSKKNIEEIKLTRKIENGPVYEASAWRQIAQWNCDWRQRWSVSTWLPGTNLVPVGWLPMIVLKFSHLPPRVVQWGSMEWSVRVGLVYKELQMWQMLQSWISKVSLKFSSPFLHSSCITCFLPSNLTLILSSQEFLASLNGMPPKKDNFCFKCSRNVENPDRHWMETLDRAGWGNVNELSLVVQLKKLHNLLNSYNQKVKWIEK